MSAVNHKLTTVWTLYTNSQTHALIHTTHSTRNLVQTLKIQPMSFCLFFTLFFLPIFVFKNSYISNLVHSEQMLSKISEVYEWDKIITKSVHITLLALLLIQVFIFFILYYSDMFMIFNLLGNTQRIHRGRLKLGAGRDWA